MALRKIACVVACCALLPACAAGPQGTSTGIASSCGNKDNSAEVMGTLVGVGLGALVGSQFGAGTGQILAATAGAALGGFLGNKIGCALDTASAQRHEAAIKAAVNNPDQGQQSWRLDEQHSSGSVTPLRSFNQNGKQCTEVMQTVTKNGQTLSDTNAYCKEPDGSLTLLN